MPKYKDLLQQRNKTQKDLYAAIHAVDPRVDNPLINKFVHNICLPTPTQADVICEFLNCGLTEIYHADELLTMNKQPLKKEPKPEAPYALNVQIDRNLINRVFSRESMKRLNIKSKSGFVRSCVIDLLKRLERLEENA